MKLKQYLITAIIALVCQSIIGQHFEIPVYFEDSAGNRDSIILGYDIMATYGINPSFGEMDLLDSAYSVKEASGGFD